MISDYNLFVVVFFFQSRLVDWLRRFGNPEITSGGNALKFYASLRMEIRKVLLHSFTINVSVPLLLIKTS
jgi:RecA/RadA recombinase